MNWESARAQRLLSKTGTQPTYKLLSRLSCETSLHNWEPAVLTLEWWMKGDGWWDKNEKAASKTAKTIVGDKANRETLFRRSPQVGVALR